MFNVLVIRAYIALERLWCHVSALLREKRGEIELPDYVLSDLARAFLSDIMGFFTVKENQVAYETWKNQRENILRTTEKS